MKRRRAVRVAAAAEVDIEHNLRWTGEQCGERQARAYAKTLAAALEELSKTPAPPAARARDDIAKGLFMLHVARRGRRGRHFVVFRISNDEDIEVTEVLRVLHDAMDLLQHPPPEEEVA